MKNSLLLKQDNLGLVAWSPFEDDPFLLARGSLLDLPETSESAEEIELLRVDPLHISEPNPLISLGSLETGVALNCLDWSPGFLEDSPKGIISGAFRDGSLVLLDAQKLLESRNKQDDLVLEEDEESDDPALLSTFTLYESQEFYCMEYNSFKSHLLATGGSDIYIVNFERSLEEPEVFSPYPPNADLLRGAKVTSICWNRNKGVQHILASAYDDGRVSIFDLKTKKSIFSLSDHKEHVRGRNVSIQWNSAIATQLGIAFDDEASGVQIWDLRNPKTPVKILDRDVVTKVHSLDWRGRDRMLLCDFEGIVHTYNSSSDTYREIYRPEPTTAPVQEPNALDVFNNLGEDTGSSPQARWLFAKSIAGIKDAFYSVNDKGNMIALFENKQEISSLASKFLDCDLASGWKKGITLNGSSLIVPDEVAVGSEASGDMANRTGRAVVPLTTEVTTDDFHLEEDEAKLVERIKSTARDWESYLGQKNAEGKQALKEKLQKKGLDPVLLSLVEMVGSTWKEKLPVFGMDQKETISKTEKVTGYKYSKSPEDEQGDAGEQDAKAPGDTGICEFADISENEALDFFSQLAKKNEQPESKKEKSVFSDKNAGAKGLYESVHEMDMEREEVLRNRDWNRGLEQLIKQNILLDNFEGAIDCAVKANRYFEGFLIAFSHPQNSQALLQKTLDKVSQRHGEDFVHGFLKPLFKKDYKSIVEKYPLEDWQEALAFIVYNLEDSQSQSECLQLLRTRIEEAVSSSDKPVSERNVQRRETVSQKVALPRETLLYLDLFQNDINNMVKHLLDQLEGLTSDNAANLVNVFEYLLFIKDSQEFSPGHGKLQALLLEFVNLIRLSGFPLMAYYLLESLGDSTNYQVQKCKNQIWTKNEAQLVAHFSAPASPSQVVWFPRESISRPAPVQSLASAKPGRTNRFNQPRNTFGKAAPVLPSKPISSPFSNQNPRKPVPRQRPLATQNQKRSLRPPGPPKIQPKFGMAGPTTNQFNPPISAKPVPPMPTRPTPGIKKPNPGPPLPPKTDLISRPPPVRSTPLKPATNVMPPLSTQKKKVVPIKPSIVKPPPPRRPVVSQRPPGPPVPRPPGKYFEKAIYHHIKRDLEYCVVT